MKRYTPIALMLAASCSVPRHEPPTAAALPLAFRNAPAGARPAPAFDPGLGDPVLAKLIARALQQATDVEIAAARLRQARAAARQSDAELAPEVGGRGTAQRRQASAAPGVAFGPRRLSTFGVGVEASWEPDIFGRLSSEAKAARRDAAAAGRDLEAVRLALVGDVALAFIDLRSADERIAVSRRNSSALQQLSRLASDREKAGLSPSGETAAATANAARAEAAGRAIVVEREAALARLAFLVGATPIEIAAEVGHGTLPLRTSEPPTGVPGMLLLNRPDVRRDLARLAAADDRTAARVRDRLPRLSLSGSLGATSTSVPALDDPASRTFSLLADLTAPLLDFGRRRAAVVEAQAFADERAGALRATLLAAIRDVEEAAAGVKERKAQVRILANALKAQGLDTELDRSRYAAGLARLDDALDAQASLASLEEESLSARAAEAKAAISLWRATGGVSTDEHGRSQPKLIGQFDIRP